MKLPDPSENIYPRSRENISAILIHYFPQESDNTIGQSVNQFLENKTFSLNQIEFGAKFASENKHLLDQAKISKQPYPRIKFALEAVFFPESEWTVWGETAVPMRRFRELFRDSFFKDWPE